MVDGKAQTEAIPVGIAAICRAAIGQKAQFHVSMIARHYAGLGNVQTVIPARAHRMDSMLDRTPYIEAQ